MQPSLPGSHLRDIHEHVAVLRVREHPVEVRPIDQDPAEDGLELRVEGATDDERPLGAVRRLDLERAADGQIVRLRPLESTIAPLPRLASTAPSRPSTRSEDAADRGAVDALTKTVPRAHVRCGPDRRDGRNAGCRRERGSCRRVEEGRVCAGVRRDDVIAVDLSGQVVLVELFRPDASTATKVTSASPIINAAAMAAVRAGCARNWRRPSDPSATAPARRQSDDSDERCRRGDSRSSLDR